NGKLTFGIFAALAEFERDLISERTKAGLNSARARGRRGGAKPKIAPYALAGVMAKADQAAIARDKEFSLAKAAAELGVHRSTLWRARDRSKREDADKNNLPDTLDRLLVYTHN
ncbi:MAG: recombinase family protein, partial [Hyphomicrobium sp.]